MKIIRAAAFVLALLFVFSAAVAAKSVKPFAGETSHKERTLHKGVVHAKITTDSSTPIYNQQHFNVLLVDMSQKDLYLETAYMNDSVRVTYGTPGSTVQGTVAQYNQKNSDKKVIAAVNGDMWLIASQTKGYVKTSEFTVSRAFNIVNGEIYTTGVIPQEPSYAGIPWAFGITDDFVPNLGQPYTEIEMTDVTKNVTLSVDGINRVPADNAVIMYTDRLMGSYNDFALDDAYEMLIEFEEDYTMRHGADVTGTLKAIYDSASSENAPKITNKQMVITARGNKIPGVEGFDIGDKINIKVQIHDALGSDDIWQRVTNSVGGNIAFIKGGVRTGADLGQTTYPTTLLGYDRDGKIIMLTMDGRGKGGTGASTARLNQIITDLDLYDAVIVDGGGSMTMVTTDNKNYDSYTTVSTSSDGSDRKVNNAFILAVGPERCEQGEIDINKNMQRIEDPTNVTFPTEDHVRSFVTGPNEAAIGWEDGCLKLTVKNLQIGDPYVNFCYVSAPSLPSADKYKYMALVYKMPKTNSQARYGTEIFCQCEYRGAEPGQSVNVATKCTDQYEYALYNPGALSKWKGEITDLRIDFMSVPMGEGDVMYIHNIILAETKDEARLIAKRIKDALNAPPEETSEEVSEEVSEDISEDVSGDISEPDGPEAKKGDCNGDGAVDNKDVVALFRYVSSGAATEDDALYDFNGDGEINNKDVVELFRFVSAN